MAKQKENAKLRALRERVGLSMEGLAKKAGVSVATVYRMEKRICVPLYDRAKKVATALKCPIEVILG